MTKELGTKTVLTVTIISVLITGMLITSNLFLADIKNVFAQDDVAKESTTTASNSVTIAATPGQSVLPSPIQRGTTTDFTLQGVLNTAPHHGNQIRVWDPAISNLQPGIGSGCTNYSTTPPPPPAGNDWVLKADSEPNGSFETVVQYNLPEDGDLLILPSFGSGSNVTPIAINANALGTDPDLVPSISSGANFAWVDESGAANTDDTTVLGEYKLGSCGTEGVSGTQNFRVETTFDVVASCTTLTKEANPTSGPFPLDVTYTYDETNCGEQGDSPLTSVTVTDIGEDADHDGSLDGSEDKNSNGILDPGCSPVVFSGGDDGDGNLEPGEIWTFECTTTLHSVGVFNNTAFSEGTICLDADCTNLDGIHTGDPACQEGTLGLLCDSAERDSLEVTVEPQTPQVTTQSNPSGNILPSAAVTDKATVKSVPPGLIPAPTGTVSFFLCNPATVTANGGNCSAGGVMIGGPVPLAGVPPMATSAVASGATTTPEGKYCWRAQYNGDANYNPASHTNSVIGINGECFQVGGKGTIKIIKDTLPDDPTDFRFTGDLGTFTLDDDNNPTRSNMVTFSNRDPGTFRVTETEDNDFPLRAIRCIDPSGDTTTNLGSATATIKLGAGETVTCTFVNGEFPPPCEQGAVSSVQPADALSMNTIVGKSDGRTIAKTIHVEKQIFDCETSDGVPLIADVTIMAEIFEDMSTKSVIHKQVEVVTCLKHENTTQLRECSLSIPEINTVVVKNCREDPLSNPQEMNTVTKGNGIIKTVEAQKEVFLCNLDNTGPDEKKVDLVLFTEVWENLVSLDSTPTDPTVLKTTQSMRCIIKIDTVTVESCVITQPQQIFP